MNKEEILKQCYQELVSKDPDNWANWDDAIENGSADMTYKAMEIYALEQKKELLQNLEYPYAWQISSTINAINDQLQKLKDGK